MGVLQSIEIGGVLNSGMRGPASSLTFGSNNVPIGICQGRLASKAIIECQCLTNDA